MNKVTEAIIKFIQGEKFGIIDTNYSVLKQITYCQISETVKRLWICGRFEEAEILDIPIAEIKDNLLFLNKQFFTVTEIKDINKNIKTPFVFVCLGYNSYKLNNLKLSECIRQDKNIIHNHLKFVA